MSRRAAAGLEILSAVGIGAAILAAYAGPLRFETASISLSVRNLTRPMVAALVFFSLRVWVAHARPEFRPSELLTITARVIAGAVITASALGWVTYLSATLGGADSYGYVSASQRILQGSLIQPEPLATLLPFEPSISAAMPLGYVPSPRVPNASVPMYPLGLPMLMAAATIVFGPVGPFALAPMMGLVLVAAGSMVAWAWYRDRDVAVIAAALVAAHPLVFTYSIQPMSDVPAAAFMLLATAAILQKPRWPLVAGLCAAMALFIRPALAPAAAAIVLLPLLVEGRSTWPHVVRAALPVVCAAVLQALTQRYLYDNTFTSGYGPVGSLFSIDRLVANVRSYGYWAVAMSGVIVVGGLGIGLATSQRVVRVTLALMTLGVPPYLFYRTYDHWETLRFLIPVLALATIVAAAGIVAACRRVAGQRAGALLAVVIVVAVAWGWVGWLEMNNVFTMPERETRHRLAGELVLIATPPDAVVMAVQHSGSLRYYTQRDTINWDQVPAGKLGITVEALKRHGRRVFLMTDSDEERAQFHARHGSIVDDDGWFPAGQRRDVQLYEAR